MSIMRIKYYFSTLRSITLFASVSLTLMTCSASTGPEGLKKMSKKLEEELLLLKEEHSWEQRSKTS